MIGCTATRRSANYPVSYKRTGVRTSGAATRSHIDSTVSTPAIFKLAILTSAIFVSTILTSTILTSTIFTSTRRATPVARFWLARLWLARFWLARLRFVAEVRDGDVIPVGDGTSPRHHITRPNAARCGGMRNNEAPVITLSCVTQAPGRPSRRASGRHNRRTGASPATVRHRIESRCSRHMVTGRSSTIQVYYRCGVRAAAA